MSRSVHLGSASVYLGAMTLPPKDAIAVIFLSGRTGADDAGYAAAAQAMERLAAGYDGYLGIESVRDAAGVGITISWWRDRAAAEAWRDDPDHVRIRDQGRALWYDWYRVIVATVDRAYDWAGRPLERHPSRGLNMPGETKPIDSIAIASCFSRAAICS